MKSFKVSWYVIINFVADEFLHQVADPFYRDFDTNPDAPF